MGLEQYGYEGKRALVVGGATGMGAATAALVKDLGGEVVVMDHALVEGTADQVIQVDLRDRAAIDVAVDACEGPVHAIFACAGVADGGIDLMKVNFIGQRHLIERFVDEGRMPAGSAVAAISSVAGMGWEKNLELVLDFLSTPDFDTAVTWMEAHAEHAHYGFAKQALLAYVARQAYPFLRRGVRINAIQPGPTDTPLARANADMWLGFAQDYRADLGIEASTPEEQASVLAFLCSDAARHVNGISFITDAGYVSSGLVGSYEAPLVRMLAGLE